MQKVRKLSAGLSFQDFRVIRANVAGILASTPRKRVTPAKLNPKPQRDMPVVFGVSPSYQRIANLRLLSGRFFDEDENGRAAPICVLGDGTRTNLLGAAMRLVSTSRSTSNGFMLSVSLDLN